MTTENEKAGLPEIKWRPLFPGRPPEDYISVHRDEDGDIAIEALLRTPDGLRKLIEAVEAEGPPQSQPETSGE